MPRDGSRAATRFVDPRAAIANIFCPPRADVLVYVGGFRSWSPNGTSRLVGDAELRALCVQQSDIWYRDFRRLSSFINAL